MLTYVEIQDVTRVLGDILLTVGPSNRETWLKGQIPSSDFQRDLNRLLKPASNHLEWAELSIQVCMERGWRGAPPSWIESLLVGMEDEPRAPRRVSNLTTILTRIRGGGDPRLEAIATEMVLNDVPFLNRGEVRKGVRELLEPEKRSVLTISGDPKSGRSYCAELFQYISKQYGYYFKVASVVIEPGQGRVYTPHLLSINIAGAMGSKDSPPQIEPAHRTIEPYKNFVLTIAEKASNHWWIVLDGFGDVPPENETRKLIQALAASIANERYGERLRLILVDYNGLQLSPLRYIPHQISRHSIGKEHIRSYFEQLNVKHSSRKTQQELDAFTNGIWESLPNDESRLTVLNDQISLLALQVIQP
jgi:hypothetical protein